MAESVTPAQAAEQEGRCDENILSSGMMTDLESMMKTFRSEAPDLRTLSPLTLAYLGDAVYEQIVRTRLVLGGRCPVNRLHTAASRLVRASAQSAIIRYLEPDLTEEEHNVYRRGRNANSHTMAKNAAMSDYRRATGFEALIGYLYLKNDRERLLELAGRGLCYLEEQMNQDRRGW